MLKLYGAKQHRIARIEQGERKDTDYVVVHTMESENIDGVENYFRTSSPDEVGAHLGISKHGELRQWADLDAVVYHAKTAGNMHGVGIELAGFAGYSKARWITRRRQRVALAGAIARLCHIYKLGAPIYKGGQGNVRGHGDVPGNDHTDPGKGFPWEAVIKLARKRYRVWYR